MAEAFAAAGHNVTVIAGKPYYPDWQANADFAAPLFSVQQSGQLTIVRCPHYIPAHPNLINRVAHYTSFAISAAYAAKRYLHSSPDLVIATIPSLFAANVAKHIAQRSGAKLWLHVQDFEVDAAFATGLLNKNNFAARIALSLERRMLQSANMVSTISTQMVSKLIAKGVPETRTAELRNWSDTDLIMPLNAPSPYRSEWGISAPHVALYSGNISRKQGIGLIVDAAKLLSHRRDLQFIICGNGPERKALEREVARLPNIILRDLQPKERLSELLGLADIHLLPQIAGAADLMLPSKMANMFASGRPVIATATTGSGIADAVEGHGLITPPGDAPQFAQAISDLLDSPEERAAVGLRARYAAEMHWSKRAITRQFVEMAEHLVH